MRIQLISQSMKKSFPQFYIYVHVESSNNSPVNYITKYSPTMSLDSKPGGVALPYPEWVAC